ncbi:MAG: MBL fold metallo-hydrolase [Acidobacteria bacterium]|nr:MBL fold metallo-hydrolase [Acidobacteriota bacterium]
MAENWLKFLGTAGARFVVTKQLRASGGLWACLEDVHILIDPGPGCLVRCLSSKPKLDPTKLAAILLSHRHLDHANDINIMMEAMSEGGFQRRGRVFVPRDALEQDPVILHYVRGYVEEIVPLRVGGRYALGPNVHFRTPLAHQHGPETFGFVFETPKRTISYITCTLYFPELAKAYAGCDLLLINTVRRKKEEMEERKIRHLSLEDARTLIEAIRPRTAILTHFGMTMVRAKPWELAKELSAETGVEVLAASDGMRFELP